VSSPSRRDLLKAGLAAVPAAALSRLGIDADNAWLTAAQPSAPAYAGFPAPGRQWHGDSSVGAALRSPTPTLPRFDRLTLERIVPEGFARARAPQPIAALRAAFPNLRRHFVFEYYPWYETNPYTHWAEKGHTPPFGIASTMMPALGPYHSEDRAVVEQHARWMADAGVGTIAISWWGIDSNTNRATPMIMDVMRAHDIHVMA